MNNTKSPAWLDGLSSEDFAFVKRFLLASGSLKETAKAYGISYPTVRLRLDRLIAKIEVIESFREQGPLELLVRSLYADGKIELQVMLALLDTHQQETGGRE